MGVVTIIGLGIIIGLRKSKIWDNIIGRKLFHFLIFFIVAFGFYLNVMLIYVSLVLVLHLFIIIEILRQLNFNQCKHYFNYFLM